MKIISTITVQGIEFTRIANDINGNPRYVCHFLSLLSDADTAEVKEDFAASLAQNPLLLTGLRYDRAVWKAKAIGGKRYNGKEYGGGIVFRSYNLADTANDIINLLN